MHLLEIWNNYISKKFMDVIVCLLFLVFDEK